MVDLESLIQFLADITDEKFLEVDTKIFETYVVNNKNINCVVDNKKNLYNKVTDVEDRSRRNNLRFDELSQARGENRHISKVKIKGINKEKLAIEDAEIECAYRFEKEKRNDPLLKRTIIAKFLT